MFFLKFKKLQTAAYLELSDFLVLAMTGKDLYFKLMFKKYVLPTFMCITEQKREKVST